MKTEMLSKDSRTDDFWSSDNGKFLAWAHANYEREIDLQRESRSERARDCDFYDGDQFTLEEKNIYDLRDQVPRAFNEIKPTIDWVIGSERRARADWNVLPRSEDDVEPAVIKTKLVKYIDDINKARFQRSKSFEDCVKSGEGWTRASVEPNEDGDIQVHLQWEHWRNIVRDSTCRDLIGMTDCKYIYCTKPVDVETLISWFPKSEQGIKVDAGDFEDLQIEQRDEMMNIEASTSQLGGIIHNVGSMSLSGGTHMTDRKAVRVWEMWYRKTERVKVLRKAGGLNNEIYNPKDPYHQHLIQQGATVRETVREQMYMAMYTRSTVLHHAKSIYAHNRFPFVCRSAFIKDSDGTPYGIIRQIRDPQSDLNARRNKALFLMSTNRVIMDKGAVDNVDILACEVAKPNGIIEKNRGFELEIQEGAVLAGQHVQMSEQDAAYIRQVAGVTAENRGTAANGKSGIAIQALQEQGTVITTPIIDNHALAHQNEGELILSLCEQFIDREMQFRITGDDINKPEFVSINSGDPQTDITATQADFIVSQKDYRQTMRQALSEQMLQVSSQITQATGDPMMAVALIEMSIDLQDLPNKDQITARLREAAGMPPRDETDEQRQQREQQEMQQKQQQAQLAQQQAEIAMRYESAKADEMQAQAKERLAEAERESANALDHKIRATRNLMEAAGMLQMRPDLAPIADDLLQNLDATLMQGKPVTQPPPPQPEQMQQPSPPSADFLTPDDSQVPNAQESM